MTGMKLRFSTRDLLWLLVLAAVCLGWWKDSQSKQEQIRELESLRKDVGELQGALEASRERENNLRGLLPPNLRSDNLANPFN